MSLPLRIPGDPEEPYTVILTHPFDKILFAGTTRGCLEILNGESGDKLAELRYLEVDDYGEKVPVDSPVLAIEPNSDYSLLYVLMGNAAYCVDVNLRLIAQQIPISENVLAGTVVMSSGTVWGLGTIAVITEVGYLSFWSPKFYERIASYEFTTGMKQSFIFFVDNEIILALQDEIIIYGDDGKKYLAHLPAEQFDTDYSHLLTPSTFSRSELISAWIENNDLVISSPGSHPPDISDDMKDGREGIISRLITELSNMDYDREYIEDFRLRRLGKDRYLAEMDALGSSDEPMRGAQVKDDNKTLTYAFDDYLEQDVHKKSIAQEVITRISARHGVQRNYLETAWRWGSVEPISYGRWLEFETIGRRDRIRLAIISMIPALLILQVFSFTIFNYFSLVSQLILLLLITFILFRWKRINADPEMYWIEDYSIARRVSWLVLIISIYRIINLYTNYGAYLPDF